MIREEEKGIERSQDPLVVSVFGFMDMADHGYPQQAGALLSHQGMVVVFT